MKTGESRLTLNYRGENVDVINELARFLNVNPTDVAIKALSLYKFLVDEMRQGSVVAVHRPEPERTIILTLDVPGADATDYNTFIVPREPKS